MKLISVSGLCFIFFKPLVALVDNDEQACSVGLSIPKGIALEIGLCKGLPKNWFAYVEKVIEGKFVVCVSPKLFPLCKPMNFLSFVTTIGQFDQKYISTKFGKNVHSQERISAYVDMLQDKQTGQIHHMFVQKRNFTVIYNHTLSETRSPLGHIRLFKDNIQQCQEKYSKFVWEFKLHTMLALNITFCKLYFSKTFDKWRSGNLSIYHNFWSWDRHTFRAIFAKFSLYLNTHMINVSFSSSECQTYELEFMFSVIDKNSLDGHLGGTTSWMWFHDGRSRTWVWILCKLTKAENFFVKDKKMYRILFSVSSVLSNLVENLNLFDGPDLQSPLAKQRKTALLKTFQGSLQIVYNLTILPILEALSMCS